MIQCRPNRAWHAAVVTGGMNPMSDRMRTALAFFLIVCILLLWTFLSRREPEPTIQEETIISDTLTPVSEETVTRPVEEEAVSQDTIVIDREHTAVVLSTQGGAVQHFTLKAHDIDIVPYERHLLISRFKDGKAIPFDCQVQGDTVRFVYRRDTFSVTKTYLFDDEHGFQLHVDVPEGFDHALDMRSGLRITEEKNSGEDLRHFNVYVKKDKVASIKGKIKDTYDVEGSVDWFGLRTKYFLFVVNTTTALERITFWKLDKDETAFIPDIEVDQAVFGCYYFRGGGNRYGAEAFAEGDIRCTVKLLPVKYSLLKEYDQGYENVTSGGILGPISRLFLAIFNILYSLFKNYGIAIIVFAVCIKLIFFPLSRQMIKSQHRMQMIQPEMKKLQQKYKDEPQRLNQEMMHLYKTYKVNPFTGCLPLIIQMPIFFALYQTLITSIEFRHAPFMLWITDLSYKDPYYVLPIAMGVMMLVQSFLTTIDPRQRYMTIIMPLFMVFIFLNFPSGLQLYWFSYNILTLVEHIIIKRGGMK
jgi:YidC/Oxa1 family membrane protein insertase